MGERIRRRSGWDLLSALNARAGAAAMSSSLLRGSEPRAEENPGRRG